MCALGEVRGGEYQSQWSSGKIYPGYATGGPSSGLKGSPFSGKKLSFIFLFLLNEYEAAKMI
jgi:hypothetical protein